MEKLRKIPQKITVLLLYTLLTSFIFLFYSFTKATIGDFSGASYARYWVSFEVTFIILFLSLVSEIAENIFFTGILAKSHLRKIFLCLFFLVFIIITSGASSNQFWGQKFLDSSTYRKDGAFAGSLTEKILPKNLSIATSEMNTFGLMVNRPIIDLWGYTNRDIATSKVCNAVGIKNNVTFFLANKPDIYWPYWFTKFSDHNKFDTVEASLATSPHTSKTGNLLGDMNEVLRKYDVFIIQANDNQLAYLVRKEVSKLLMNHLENQQFKLLRVREINWKYFSDLYNSQKLVQYDCS